MNPLLKVNRIAAAAGKKRILKGVSLAVRSGEVHAIMGPNGSGKSTLASVIMGHPSFTVTGGTMTFNGKSIATKTPEERARLGLFLSFQYPSEVPGLSIENFLRTAYNNLHPVGQLPVVEFHRRFTAAARQLHLRHDLAQRGLNEGFSGGEKKKLEILQLMVLKPKLAILDETDSGLDIDALKNVAAGINALRDSRRSFVVITHYIRILRYLRPDYVHVMADGAIVRSGGRELAGQIENRGYGWLVTERR
ncbi:MAG: Fe-S cluster assembly ATPase SufC [Patescibacteria group bacterium]